MTAGAQEAVEVTAGILDLYGRAASWEEVQKYLQGILRLAPELEAQKPADENWYGAPAETARKEQDEQSKRMVSAAGRLFRKHTILDIFRKSFGWISLLEPREMSRLRSFLSAYNDELNKQLKTLTVKISPDLLYENFLLPQASALSLAIAAVEQAMRIIHTEKNKSDAELSALVQVLKEIKEMLEQDMSEIQSDIEAIQETQNEETRLLSHFLL